MTDQTWPYPPESDRERVKRTRTGKRERRHPIVRWLLTFGVAVASVTTGIFLLAGSRLGWGPAFEVLGGYKAPSDICGHGASTCTHKLAYLLGVLGYVFIPAFIGAVAALLVDLGVSRYTVPAHKLDEQRRQIFEDR